MRYSGFTLIELLIVMAVLGVLATVTLVAIDPLEQIERGRDAGRKTTVAQLGHALQAYAITHAAQYPLEGTDWITKLINAGELKNVPEDLGTPRYGCAFSIKQNNWCYERSDDGYKAAAFTRLLSKIEINKCVDINGAFWVWDSTRGHACLVCQAAPYDPDVPAQRTNPGDPCHSVQ